MMIKITPVILLLILLDTPIILLAETTQPSRYEINSLPLVAQLGQQIFFDTNLSSPAGQSCASCHDPKTAYTDPDVSAPVSPGIIAGRHGTRNAPSVMYAKFSPVFYFDSTESTYVGGQFLDGRSPNLTQQAKQPFLNPDEMNNANAEAVVVKLRNASYANLFRQVYGIKALDDVEQAFQNMADALTQFENTTIFSPFSSKYDYFLAGEAQLTDQERWGMLLFNDEHKGNCAACHPSTSEDSTPPLFTDFTYDNLGLPPNPAILTSKSRDFPDLGLGKSTGLANQNGKFKVPSLRNIAKTAPYTHNGLFTSLREVVEFYNSRDVDPKWEQPEVAETKNMKELGNLKLSSAEIDAIVAFLGTLTDGYVVEGNTPHLNNSGLITLPKIRITGSIDSLVAKVILKNVENARPNVYRVLYVEDLDANTELSNALLPVFSFDNNLLEIPRIQVDDHADHIAQLRRLPDAKEYLFELIYAKALQ